MSTSIQSPSVASVPVVAPAVGVVLVGHGRTASELLAAAAGIVGPDALEGVQAVDAGTGQTPKLDDDLCGVLAQADQGAGVLLLVDLWGASPYSCARRQAEGRRAVILSGLNLAMLLKLAALDRHRVEPEALAQACADSGRRAVDVQFLSPKMAAPPTDPPNPSIDRPEPHDGPQERRT
jgi:PTS system mannose-specific IIA component